MNGVDYPVLVERPPKDVLSRVLSCAQFLDQHTSYTL